MAPPLVGAAPLKAGAMPETPCVALRALGALQLRVMYGLNN